MYTVYIIFELWYGGCMMNGLLYNVLYAVCVLGPNKIF